MNVSRMAWNEGVTHEPDRCDPQECRCGLPWPCEIKRVMDERDALRTEVERQRAVADAARAYHHWWAEDADDSKGEGMRLWNILCRAIANDGGQLITSPTTRDLLKRMEPKEQLAYHTQLSQCEDDEALHELNAEWWEVVKGRPRHKWQTTDDGSAG